MWPILLDMTKVDCKRMLRRLELEAYGNMVSALRAQGGLSSEKHKLLQDLSATLNIPQERHRAEIRRAVNDERLATIAYCMTGDDTTDEWAIEGRRLVPLMPRMVPQTAYSVIADDEANKASLENDKLPVPAATERKRPLQTVVSEPNKNIQYATSEFTAKHANQYPPEESTVKKRKPSMNMQESTLAQHLIMGPPKISRVQQLYRQKTKAILKQQMKQRGPPNQHITNVQKSHRKIDEEIKNISHSQNPVQKSIENKCSIPLPVTNNSTLINENASTPSKTSNIQVVKPATSNTNSTKIPSPVVVNTAEIGSKSIKICPARKVITTTSRAQNQSQKLIIVSNSQGNTTSSILQRTLTIPFVKTISMKNLDKLKVINNASTSVSSSASNINQKPKLVTVHTKMKTNTTGKPINIPFIQGVQLQALQNKGAIKMVPLSTTTKISSKPGLINTSGSVYIMNSNAISAVTSSNSSPIMTPKPVTSSETENHRNVYIIKTEDIKSGVSVITSNSENLNNQNVVLLNVQPQKEQKSSVLSDILKASGVIPEETENESLLSEQFDIKQETCDIETEISQLTEIPTAVDASNMAETAENEIQSIEIKVENSEMQELDSVEIQGIDNAVLQGVTNVEIQDIQETENTELQEVENTEIEMDEVNGTQEIVHFENVDEISSDPEPSVDHTNYVILQDETNDANMLVCEIDEVHQKENNAVLEVMGNLDPETGMYSIQESPETETIIQDEPEQESSSFVIEMESIHDSELDMPNLGLN